MAVAFGVEGPFNTTMAMPATGTLSQAGRSTPNRSPWCFLPLEVALLLLLSLSLLSPPCLAAVPSSLDVFASPCSFLSDPPAQGELEVRVGHAAFRSHLPSQNFLKASFLGGF